MIRCINILLLSIFLLHAQHSNAHLNNSISGKRYTSAYTHEFFVSAGYNYCRYNFLDAGVRYYHWRNDGQTAMAFAGTAIGCEFSTEQADQIYIPYIGWQGQLLMLGYGLRAEYAISKANQSFGVTPELGFSLFEILRITGGYRFSFAKSDALELKGFRFSVIAALPLSFLKDDNE